MIMPSVLAILQARVSSSRLPGKVLLPILGQPMLALQIERLRRCGKIDHLVVATATQCFIYSVHNFNTPHIFGEPGAGGRGVGVLYQRFPWFSPCACTTGPWALLPGPVSGLGYLLTPFPPLPVQTCGRA